MTIAPPRLRVRLIATGPDLAVAAGAITAVADDAVVAALTGRGPAALLEVGGRRIERRSPARRVRAGLAVVGGTSAAPDLGVRDHLAAAANAARADRILAAAPLLARRGADPAGVLSGGERRVLGWLVALALRPRAVVLDRAGTGLDEDTLGWAHGRVDDWLDGGTAVVVVPGRREETRWVTHRADGSAREGGAG